MPDAFDYWPNPSSHAYPDRRFIDWHRSSEWERGGLVLLPCRVAELPNLTTYLADSAVRAYCGGRRGVRLMHVPPWTWVGADAWTVRDGESSRPATVDEINQTLDHAGVGGWPTPGKLAQAVLSHRWPAADPPLQRPPWYVHSLLAEHIVGGRVDHVTARLDHGCLWCADINNAYGAELLSLPSGRPSFFDPSQDWGDISGPWIAPCLITPPESPVPLGPVPKRDRYGRLSYPRSREEGGPWVAWLWFEEVYAAAAAGFGVQFPDDALAISWEDWTTAAAPGALELSRLRRDAPSPQVADLIKQATVELIGLWAAPHMRLRLSASGTGTRHYDESLGEVPGAVELEEWPEHGINLVAQASYIYMRARMKLYLAALPAAKAGSLVSTDYDAIYTTERPEWLPESANTGEWKIAELHANGSSLGAPYPRAIISKEKLRLPGVARNERGD